MKKQTSKQTDREDRPEASWREQYPVHEAADLFPLLEGQEFDELVADIKAYGLREPIVRTADAKTTILDGRNRLRACLVAGIEPKFVTFRGPGKAIQYVISANLRRRHLTESQRSMIAAKLADLRQGARTDLAENSAMSQPEAAQALNVSRGSVQNAKKVLDDGTRELVEAVRDGHIKVGKAKAVATLEPEAQREIVRNVKRGVKPAAAVPKTKPQVPRVPASPPTPEDRSSAYLALREWCDPRLLGVGAGPRFSRGQLVDACRVLAADLEAQTDQQAEAAAWQRQRALSQQQDRALQTAFGNVMGAMKRIQQKTAKENEAAKQETKA